MRRNNVMGLVDHLLGKLRIPSEWGTQYVVHMPQVADEKGIGT